MAIDGHSPGDIKDARRLLVSEFEEINLSTHPAVLAMLSRSR